MISQNRVFRAGASISNITPPLGEPIVGNYDSPLATHIHDQINVRSLVLDDGTNRIAIALVDNVSIKREVFDHAKRLIQERTGLAANHILTAATHTHSSISASGSNRKGWNSKGELDAYQQFVADRIADGVQVAINNLEPAKIGWGKVDVPQHVFNRRWIMKEPVLSPFGERDIAKMNPGFDHETLLRPAGPVDPEVSFLAVVAVDGRPISLLGNYSLHYVGGVPKGDISADYFALFADRIQQLLSADRQTPPFVGILSNGTSGDINNINFGGNRENHEPYEKMKIVANDVAEAVFRQYQKTDFKNWVPLASSQSELTLQVRRASAQVLENVKKIKARPDDAEPLFNTLEKIYVDRVEQMEVEWPDQVIVPIQALRIGDLGIAAIPFETFAETGLEIKKKSPFDQTFTIELANGSYGYLPTPEQHKLGGYESWLTTNRVEFETSSKIVDMLLSLFNSLR
ncbi:MAG: hypothetical protein IPL46_25585 [Saprospiraceae bacterium]|nr:hypothetical protein [Saprospiraceae bacterium]